MTSKTDPTQLLRFIENEHAGEAGIVYRQSRNGSMMIASTLADHGLKALAWLVGLGRSTDGITAFARRRR
jgi:ATP-dependent DNA helicase RecQ